MRRRLLWMTGMVLVVGAAYAMGVRHSDTDVLLALSAAAVGGILIGTA